MADPRSAGDAFGSILTDWRSFAHFLGKIVVLILVLAVLARALLFLADKSGLQAGEVELSGSPRVVLQQVTERGREYRILVSPAAHPSPWQDTEIEIEPGDSFEIEAEGRVNVNLYGLFQHVERRHAIEARIDSALQRGTLRPGPDSSRLPERFYSELDRVAIEIRRGWTGPEGEEAPGGITDAAYPARTENKLVPNAPFGMLIGAVHRGTHDPPRRTAFLVGGRWRDHWSGPAGTLRFAVNDVWDGEDERFPDKFYVDNLGFFLVRVVVPH
ncbi:MAG TPA: hypothetical protein VEW03_10515 [Longimicrobiaceae bacterium]|nr:hypothetical protein [Longimicrobiaceae bacterium]